jgi:hypothetical protein
MQDGSKSGAASFWLGLNSFRVARCGRSVSPWRLDRPRLPPVIVVGARAFNCRAQSGQRATKLNLFSFQQCSRKLRLKGCYRPKLCKNARSTCFQGALYHSRPRENAVVSDLKVRVSPSRRLICVFTQSGPKADVQVSRYSC